MTKLLWGGLTRPMLLPSHQPLDPAETRADEQRFLALVRRNPVNALLIERIIHLSKRNMAKVKAKTVSDYIASAPLAAQKNLLQLRALLRSVAPDAVEAIKWGVPVFEEGRILFSFSAHKAHINFMPTNSALHLFKEELAGFKTGAHTMQLPYGAVLPKALIRKLAACRLRQVREEGALWVTRGE